MPRRYVVLDVFTDRPLAGNPLAVVLDAEGLDDGRMQSIAREFNLSETVFLLPPRDARHRARARIFTPMRELPFAGHPTVGAAVLLGLKAGSAADALAFGLEEEVGIVPCVVEARGERAGHARFRLPQLPFVDGEAPDEIAVAWALGLDPASIGFDRHVTSRHSAGNAFCFVPVASREAVARAKPAGEAFENAFGGPDRRAVAFVYTRETEEPGRHFHARMFGQGMGVYEDPATGSAVAAFAGVLMQCEPLGDGEHSFVVEQGFEMGRPSLIELGMTIRGGALVSAEIGGGAVIVAEGELAL
jgi:trans-2,3-dihydro-3-hydroxyanthranilate isomerase